MLVIGLGAAGIAVTRDPARGRRHAHHRRRLQGALHIQREDYLDGSMNPVKRWFAEVTNPDCRAGAPADVIDGIDLLDRRVRRARRCRPRRWRG